MRTPTETPRGAAHHQLGMPVALEPVAHTWLGDSVSMDTVPGRVIHLRVVSMATTITVRYATCGVLGDHTDGQEVI